MEERILERASGKKSLEALVIQAGQFHQKGQTASSVKREVLEEILALSTEEVGGKRNQRMPRVY